MLSASEIVVSLKKIEVASGKKCKTTYFDLRAYQDIRRSAQKALLAAKGVKRAPSDELRRMALCYAKITRDVLVEAMAEPTNAYCRARAQVYAECALGYIEGNDLTLAQINALVDEAEKTALQRDCY